MSEAGRPPRREQLPPPVVWACCLVLLGVFAVYGFAPETTRTAVLANFAFVPARAAIALDVAQGALQASVQRLPQETFTALIGAGGGRWWTLATYASLHASWPQLWLNVCFLAVFGTPVARRLRAWRFLVLLLAATVVGAAVQLAFDAASFVPVVGASTAVSGSVGAAVRFVFPPRSGASALFHPACREGATSRPTLGLAETFANPTTFLLILAWIAYSLLIGLFPSLPGAARPPSWPALVASVLVGVLAFPLLDPRRPEKAARAGLEDVARP